MCKTNKETFGKSVLFDFWKEYKEFDDPTKRDEVIEKYATRIDQEADRRVEEEREKQKIRDSKLYLQIKGTIEKALTSNKDK